MLWDAVFTNLTDCIYLNFYLISYTHIIKSIVFLFLNLNLFVCNFNVQISKKLSKQYDTWSSLNLKQSSTNKKVRLK